MKYTIRSKRSTTRCKTICTTSVAKSKRNLHHSRIGSSKANIWLYPQKQDTLRTIPLVLAISQKKKPKIHTIGHYRILLSTKDQNGTSLLKKW